MPKLSPSRAHVNLAMLPVWIIVTVGMIGSMIWTFVISLTNSRLLPVYHFNFFDQYVRLMKLPAWRVAVENLFVFGVLFIVICLVLGFLMAIMIDQRIRGESLFRTIFLYPYAMSFVVTGLVWQWVLNPSFGIQATVRSWGYADFTFDWIVRPDRAIFILVLAAVWQGSGLVMAILLAGLRGVDEDLWKATKVDGIPKWRVYVSIVLPLIAPMAATATVLLSISVVKAYDLVVALTGGGPGDSTEVPAKFVMENLFARQNVALANAGAVTMLVAVIAVLLPMYYARRSHGAPQGGLTMQTKSENRMARIGVYAFLIIAAAFFLMPLYVMIVTSLKTMDEVRASSIFALPARPTLKAWADAWGAACTGLTCKGVSVGFVNSLWITIPATALSIMLGAMTGYALSFWNPRGAGLIFGVLVISAFIPYQVFIYPLVRMMSQVGIYNSLTGIILIHVTFGMPIMVLMFRNYYAGLPRELFSAARVDGGGFWVIFFRLILPLSPPILIVAVILQTTAYLERLPLRSGLCRGQEPADDGSSEQHRQYDAGRKGL